MEEPTADMFQVTPLSGSDTGISVSGLERLAIPARIEMLEVLDALPGLHLNVSESTAQDVRFDADDPTQRDALIQDVQAVVHGLMDVSADAGKQFLAEINLPGDAGEAVMLAVRDSIAAVPGVSLTLVVNRPKFTGEDNVEVLPDIMGATLVIDTPVSFYLFGDPEVATLAHIGEVAQTKVNELLGIDVQQ
ncbi:MAG TPA: hypothetical protein VLF91_03605 [Candidatus Saccharimonadales bacterium]|nr:hypothetical protein [Candidatus Saccharimonadales bacterium]